MGEGISNSQSEQEPSTEAGYKHLYNIIGQFIKENPTMAITYIAYLTVVCLQDIVMPHLSGKLVNAIQKNLPLLKPFVLIVATVLAIQVLYTITEWHDMLMFPNMQAFLRSKLIDKIFERYRQDFAEIEVASVLAKLTKLPYSLFGFMDHYRYYIVPQLVVYLIAIGYLMKHDMILGAALAIVVIILIVTIVKAPSFCEHHAWATEHATNELAEETDDVFNNLMTVYSHDQEEYEKKRLSTMHNEYIEEAKKTIKCTFVTKSMLFPLVVIFISFFMYRCYRLVKSKKIDSGKFVSLFLMTFYITNSMWGLIGQIREVIPRWGRIKENMTIYDSAISSSTANNKSQGFETVSTMNSGLVLKDVWYKYSSENDWIIKGASLQIKPKERVAFIGRIGSGKTTLLKLIMGYKYPQKGEISIDGIPYRSLNISDLRRMIGYIHQYPLLFNRTILDNITYGSTPESPITREQVQNIMKKYGIEDIFANQPKGLDTEVGRKGHRLSGGQRQMIWLLRVILLNPKMMSEIAKKVGMKINIRLIIY